jgi:hypothetical protein
MYTETHKRFGLDSNIAIEICSDSQGMYVDVDTIRSFFFGDLLVVSLALHFVIFSIHRSDVVSIIVIVDGTVYSANELT